MRGEGEGKKREGREEGSKQEGEKMTVERG